QFSKVYLHVQRRRDSRKDSQFARTGKNVLCVQTQDCSRRAINSMPLDRNTFAQKSADSLDVVAQINAANLASVIEHQPKIFSAVTKHIQFPNDLDPPRAG